MTWLQKNILDLIFIKLKICVKWQHTHPPLKQLIQPLAVDSFELWISEKLKLDSQDQKELLKRNEKHFSLFKKCALLDLQNSKNIADATFKATVDILIWINL